MTNYIYGFHGTEAQLHNAPQLIKLIYVASDRQDERLTALIKLANMQGVKVESLVRFKLDKLVAGNKHQGVVAVIAGNSIVPSQTLKQFLAVAQTKEQSIVMVLDGITDPHNLGAIIRTCDCFGVDGVIIPKDNSASINATVIKTSSGAVNHIPVMVVNNLVRALEELKEHGYWIAGTTLAANSTELFGFKPDKKVVWVMGSEDKGIRHLVAENCDYLVSIPMDGKTGSLNVSVAVGVVLSYTAYVNYKQ